MSSFAVPSTAPPVRQVHRTGAFDLDCDADTAFPLFSPEGEREWVSVWDPEPVFPDQITFARDTVFREGKGADQALWTIVDVDWQIHRAEYVRLAPASHSGHIIVEVESTGPSRCRVVVSYVITVLGEGHARLLDAFSEAAYAAKMQEWSCRISNLLARR
jgi:hypothetical protein